MPIGLAVTFAVVATLAAVAGWVVAANQYGRAIAITLFAAFGLTLVLPGLAESTMRPLVGLGAKLSDETQQSGPTHGTSVVPSVLLGIATGLLWPPVPVPYLASS